MRWPDEHSIICINENVIVGKLAEEVIQVDELNLLQLPVSVSVVLEIHFLI